MPTALKESPSSLKEPPSKSRDPRRSKAQPKFGPAAASDAAIERFRQMSPEQRRRHNVALQDIGDKYGSGGP